MIWLWLIPLLVAVVLVLGVLGFRRVRVFGHHVHIERTQQLFFLQHDRLEAHFLEAAQVSGEPPDCKWRACTFNHDVRFARNRRTGELAAVVGLQAELETVDGTEQGAPRQASAVFFFDQGHWRTTGKAFFDRTPAEVLEQFKGRYQPLVRH